MRDTELYHHLLGIEEPWQVVDVELDLVEEVVRVLIDFDGENLNGQIQRIKTNARGSRRLANFRIAVLFFLWKLNLYPQTSR